MSDTNANKCVSCVYISELPCSGKCYRWNRYEPKQPAPIDGHICTNCETPRMLCPMGNDDRSNLTDCASRTQDGGAVGIHAKALLDGLEVKSTPGNGEDKPASVAGQDKYGYMTDPFELRKALRDVMDENAELISKERDVMGVLEDDGLAKKVADECNTSADGREDSAGECIDAYRNAARERVYQLKSGNNKE